MLLTLDIRYKTIYTSHIFSLVIKFHVDYIYATQYKIGYTRVIQNKSDYACVEQYGYSRVVLYRMYILAMGETYHTGQNYFYTCHNYKIYFAVSDVPYSTYLFIHVS